MSIDELTARPATELIQLMRERIVSPLEIIEAYLDRIEKLNTSLNAIVTLAAEARDQARAAEAAIVKGNIVGLLHGLPFTVKDTIATAGLLTTSGSLLLSRNKPTHDSGAVARAKAAGAIILGKTNVPEMAIPYETDNPVFGRTNNPYDLHRTCGGSSGGEAAAIAACLSPAGIGSDLSGSIRVPAHFCGIVGLKPTPGHVPMDGHIPAADSVLSLGASIGPMARSVADVNLLFNVLVGKDSPPPYEPGRIRVGVYRGDENIPLTQETQVAIDAVVSAFRDAHFEVVEVTPKAFTETSRLWVELFSATAANQLREFYQGKEDQAGPLVARTLQSASGDRFDMAGKIARAERRARALVERQHLRDELLSEMRSTPVIVMPVGSTPAFEHGITRVLVQGQSISVFRAFSYSQTANVFGLPSISVPVQLADGLPIGVQILGGPDQEEIIIAAAAVIEARLGGWQRPAGY